MIANLCEYSDLNKNGIDVADARCAGCEIHGWDECQIYIHQNKIEPIKLKSLQELMNYQI